MSCGGGRREVEQEAVRFAYGDLIGYERRGIRQRGAKPAAEPPGRSTGRHAGPAGCRANRREEPAMLILDWMHSDAVAVTPATTLLESRRLLKEHKLGRLPVVDRSGAVVGILSATDIKAILPAQSTGLDMLEAFDVLSETKAGEVMTSPAVTIGGRSTMTQAAMLMIEKGVTCLPVVDESGRLIGMLTQDDVFRGLTHMSGAQVIKRAAEIGFTLENRPGTLRAILEQVSGVRIASVLSSVDEQGMRQVEIVIWAEDPEKVRKVLEHFSADPCLRYWAWADESRLNERLVGEKS